MSEKKSRDYLKEAEVFINQKGFSRMLEAPATTDEEQYIKQAIYDYRERLENLTELRDKLIDLVSHEKGSNSDDKLDKKLRKIQIKKRYPTGVRNLNYIYSGLIGGGLGYGIYQLVGNYFGGSDPALWAPGLILLGAGIGAALFSAAFTFIAHSLKKNYNPSLTKKRHFIRNRVRNKSLERLAAKEKEIEKMRTSKNAVKLDVRSNIDNLLNNDINAFFDKNNLLKEDYGYLEWDAQEKLVSTIDDIIDCKKEMSKLQTSLESIKIQKAATKTEEKIQETTTKQNVEVTQDTIIIERKQEEEQPVIIESDEGSKNEPTPQEESSQISFDIDDLLKGSNKR